MKRSLAVGIAVLLLALIAGSMYCLAAATARNSGSSRGRVITIKTEIAEIVINTPILSVLEGGRTAAAALPRAINTPILSLLEGEQASIGIKTKYSQKPESKPKRADETLLIETLLTWVPTVAQDGTVKLSGSLKYIRQGYKSQNVKLSATVKPGEPQKLPVIVVPEDIGGSNLQLALTVTATVQDSPKDAPSVDTK